MEIRKLRGLNPIIRVGLPGLLRNSMEKRKELTNFWMNAIFIINNKLKIQQMAKTKNKNKVSTVIKAEANQMIFVASLLDEAIGGLVDGEINKHSEALLQAISQTAKEDQDGGAYEILHDLINQIGLEIDDGGNVYGLRPKKEGENGND